MKSLDYNIITKSSIHEKLPYNGQLDLVRAALNVIKVPSGFDLFLHSDAYPGTGLGASSALVVGIVGAYSGSLLIRQLLFETQLLDAPAYAGAVGFLGLVALAACLLPAWRATRVNLVDVLRSE